MWKTNPFVRALISVIIIAVLGYMVLNKFVFSSPVFEFKDGERLDSGLGYYEDRRLRNAKSMAMSFDELEAKSNYFIEKQEWGPALYHLKMAKSIYPENIDVRKNLCYVYMHLCSKDWRYCRYAKREVYYAHQNLPVGDHRSQDYIQRLIQIIDIEEIVEMEETEALAAIF